MSPSKMPARSTVPLAASQRLFRFVLIAFPTLHPELGHDRKMNLEPGRAL
jgi:hypothetical protein